ncbi:hypothetical protein PVAND_017049 [Polypedilum vanderplanki]|uniref:Uncharacterized protein n=1 Tax=Polypedilum vanderplanki TaxID=319348 RepID=A0A9J6BHG6_POLVA|nr:hypothetical protein PVAND_017049 [Polypedilum vanderplanki]
MFDFNKQPAIDWMQLCIHKFNSSAFDCCILECMAKKFDYYNSGILNKENLFLALTSSIDKNNPHLQKWHEIVNNTIYKCSDLIPHGKKDNDTCKEVPDYVHLIVSCTLKYNFIECPNMKNSEECQKIMEFVKNPSENCSTTVGHDKIVNHVIYII